MQTITAASTAPAPLLLEYHTPQQQQSNYPADVLVDALPYIDQFDQASQEMVDQMLQEEIKRDPAAASASALDVMKRVPELKKFNSFQSGFLDTELPRLTRGHPIAPMDFKRYSLPAPDESNRNNPAAWHQAVSNAQAQVEHQNLRLLNLELINTYGSNTWINYNKYLEQVHERLSKILTSHQSEIQEINIQRKLEQTQCGTQLKILEERWRASVAKNGRISVACNELEQELASLQKELDELKAHQPEKSDKAPEEPSKMQDDTETTSTSS
ncbi:pre-mRNA-splicing factor SPF27 [Pelomyxa schiedti]|nr:pre-mRNA-splicing factor SPF27 [Pelomyxa schiedti]